MCYQKSIMNCHRFPRESLRFIGHLFPYNPIKTTLQLNADAHYLDLFLLLSIIKLESF